MFVCKEHKIPVEHEELFCPICAEIEDAKTEAYEEGLQKGFEEGAEMSNGTCKEEK